MGWYGPPEAGDCSCCPPDDGGGRSICPCEACGETTAPNEGTPYAAGSAPCCLDVTFADVENGTCGECGVLNGETFRCRQLVDDEGYRLCEWECDFIEWDCGGKVTVTITGDQQSDESLSSEQGDLPVTMRVQVGDCIWEKVFDDAKPDCFASHELEWVSGTLCEGGDSPESWSVATVSDGGWGDGCACGDCSECEEGRTPVSLLIDVVGIEEGGPDSNCSGRCYCLNGRWGLNFWQDPWGSDRCLWVTSYGCRPVCQRSVPQYVHNGVYYAFPGPYAKIERAEPGVHKLSVWVGDRLYSKTWYSPPDCQNWSMLQLDRDDSQWSPGPMCDNADVFVTAAQSTTGNKQGWEGPANDRDTGTCVACECDETVEPSEPQPAQLQLTWDPQDGAFPFPAEVTLTRNNTQGCDCYYASPVIAETYSIHAYLRVDAEGCYYRLWIIAGLPSGQGLLVLWDQVVRPGTPLCRCDPIDMDFGDVDGDGFNMGRYTNTRVREV